MLDFSEWKAQQEAEGHHIGGYGGNIQYNEYVEEFEDTTHPAWEAENDRIQAENDEARINDYDPESIPDAEDPQRYIRNDHNVFEGEAFEGEVVEPLQPSSEATSVFAVPAMLRTRAAASAIDRSAPATDPAAFQQLDADQAALEATLDSAPNDAARERALTDYLETHDYWIDRGEEPDAQPVLMAAAWSNGAPRSELFGGDRAVDPHATFARSGIEGVNDMGQDATIDVVQNLYVDGSTDDIVQTSFEGPGGAERTVVTGEHTNAAGVITESDRHANSVISRITDGLPPLAVTEVSRGRFDEVTGEPVGEQYNAVATSDPTMTTLEEQRDYYNSDGTIYDTKIDTTNMSRNFDDGLTEDFLAANRAMIAEGRNDDVQVDREGTSITVPPAGSYQVESHTDIDYDDDGNAIFQQVDETSTAVTDAGDDNANGVRVNQTDTTRITGERGGSTAIFDADGRRIAPEDVTTTISSSEFDPDAGTAGGNHGLGHQFREISTITMHQTIGADGSATGEWATPLTTQTLREGFDDDWVFDEKYLATNAQGQLVNDDGEVATAENGGPSFVRIGDEITDEHGNRIIAGADLFEDGEIPSWVDGDKLEIHEEGLDGADKFEEFMEGWGGRIVGVAAIAAGIGGAVFTGGASLALVAVGVGLAGTSFAYTALNYSQGEASGWDLAIAGAGVALAALPAITGVKQLVNAGRAGAAARLAGASDDIVRTVADDALRSGAGFGRTTTNALRTAEAAETGLDGLDAYDAGRAALQGDFWGAGLMLGAIGTGAAIGRARTRGFDVPDIAYTPNIGVPDVDLSNVPDVDVPGFDAPDINAPSISSGAPRITTPDAPGVSSTQPLPGTATGADGAPGTPAIPDSQVGSAFGPAAGADGPGVAAAASTQLQLPDAPRPTSPTPAAFPDAVVADPRATTATPAEIWRDQSTFDGHVDKHVSHYSENAYAAAGIEPPTTASGRPIVDADSYHERSLDYREMAVTGRLEADVELYNRANGGTMLVNRRTMEVAFINADGTVGSLIPRIDVKGRKDGSGTYKRNGNSEASLEKFVDLELKSDDLVYAVRRAQANGDPIAMQQALDSLSQLNPYRHRAIVSELEATAGTPAAAGAQGLEYGRQTTRDTGGARLEPPLPRDRDVRGDLVVYNPQAAANLPALSGPLNAADPFAPIARGIGADGRIAVDWPQMRRNTAIDSLINTNPDVVARLGGADAVRANPSLLDGESLNVRRSDGTVQPGWVADGVDSNGNIDMVAFERRSMDVGEYLVQRQQADPGFDGRGALRDLIAADPTMLNGRPLRLRRSDSSIARGNAAHNIDDGWYVQGTSRNDAGTINVALSKQYRFEDLSGSLRQDAVDAGKGPGDIIEVRRSGIRLDEVLDFNRARLEGDHGQVPNLQVRYRTPDGHLMGTNRDLQPSEVSARADQAVVHTQAALDYLYSRYGYTPTGGDITLVIDADGAHNNASMQSHGNVLRIGTHDSNGGAFDPSVIMHELGHKMVDDLTIGHYGATQAGAIHEGFADVAGGELDARSDHRPRLRRRSGRHP